MHDATDVTPTEKTGKGFHAPHSIVSAAANFTASVSRFAASGFKTVDAALHGIRVGQCRTCEHRRGSKCAFAAASSTRRPGCLTRIARSAAGRAEGRSNPKYENRRQRASPDPDPLRGDGHGRHNDAGGGRSRYLHGLRRADRRGWLHAAVRLRWASLRRGHRLRFHGHAAFRSQHRHLDSARSDRILGRAGQPERVRGQ